MWMGVGTTTVTAYDDCTIRSLMQCTRMLGYVIMMYRCGSLATLACDHTRPSKATHKHISALV